MGGGRVQNEKPSAPKRGRAQNTLIECSSDSLAVFYVEQVALNRHVSSKTSIHRPLVCVKAFFERDSNLRPNERWGNLSIMKSVVHPGKSAAYCCCCRTVGRVCFPTGWVRYPSMFTIRRDSSLRSE